MSEETSKPRLIEVKLPGHVLFLTAEEFARLLAHDPELWELALKRGKGVLRWRQAQSRQSKAPARCREPSGPW